MKLASIVRHHLDAFKAKYGARLLPSHWNALDAILRCHTPQAGELYLHCPECDHPHWQPKSCGHRSCPSCQNHEVTQWLDRQRAKVVPVDYFMVTFTLPAELRTLAWHHQSVIYDLLFACASRTLKEFGMNPKHLGAEMGMTAILHTHTRRLEYHPHVHGVVPAGGIDRHRRQWKKKKGDYLFNEFALAKVFRAKFLEALHAAPFTLPKNLPLKWVVNCRRVGKGKPALQYLSRYLYRGVISEHNIVAHQEGKVTFHYIESKTGQTRTRTLQGEDFVWLVLQHVLPKGFRRARDYGFLHGNAKKRLALVQLVLQVMLVSRRPCPRPVFRCPHCQSPMKIVAHLLPAGRSG